MFFSSSGGNSFNFSLELALDLFLVFDGLSLTLKKQQLHRPLLSGHFTIMDRHHRSPTGWFFGVLKIDVFKARSTPPHQPLTAMRPSSSITGIRAIQSPALCLIPISTCQCVDHTLLRVDLTHRRLGPTRRVAHHRRPPLPVQPLFFEFMLLCYVTVFLFLLFLVFLYIFFVGLADDHPSTV